jgi:hypothetical protein
MKHTIEPFRLMFVVLILRNRASGMKQLTGSVDSSRLFTEVI